MKQIENPSNGIALDRAQIVRRYTGGADALAKTLQSTPEFQLRTV